VLLFSEEKGNRQQRSEQLPESVSAGEDTFGSQLQKKGTKVQKKTPLVRFLEKEPLAGK